MLPDTWDGKAEIIFVNTGTDYEINASEVFFGRPSGLGTSLVIRGDYTDQIGPSPANSFDRNHITLSTLTSGGTDEVIGAVLTQISRIDNAPFSIAASIRGNGATAGRSTTLDLQSTMPAIPADTLAQPPSSPAGVSFAVQRPAVTLVPNNTLTLSSADPNSPNITMIGIRVAPRPGRVLNLINFRAQCDTCEFFFQRDPALPASTRWVACNVHTNSRIQGGIENASFLPRGLLNSRGQAGVFIRAGLQSDIILVSNYAVLGGHLTFKDINVQVSQGARFAPKSLEAFRSPIHILADGQALGLVGGWGYVDNKARIRIDGGSFGTFGPSEAPWIPTSPPRLVTGLITEGTDNAAFGMNIRNGSSALVGSDTALSGVHVKLR